MSRLDEVERNAVQAIVQVTGDLVTGMMRFPSPTQKGPQLAVELEEQFEIAKQSHQRKIRFALEARSPQDIKVCVLLLLVTRPSWSSEEEWTRDCRRC